jgi:hypothetical protein
MLPFIRKKQEGGSISATPEVVTRKSDNEDEESYDHLDSASDDLISAIKSGSASGVSMALRAAFEIMEESPHEENNQMEGEE